MITPPAARIGCQTVNLPLSPKSSDAGVDRVIDTVRDTILRSGT